MPLATTWFSRTKGDCGKGPGSLPVTHRRAAHSYPARGHGWAMSAIAESTVLAAGRANRPRCSACKGNPPWSVLRPMSSNPSRWKRRTASPCAPSSKDDWAFAAATGQPDPRDMIDNLLASARQGEQITHRLSRPPRHPRCSPTIHPWPRCQPRDWSRSAARSVQTLTYIDRNASVHVDMQKSVERVTLRNTAGAEIDEEFGCLTIGRGDRARASERCADPG